MSIITTPLPYPSTEALRSDLRMRGVQTAAVYQYASSWLLLVPLTFLLVYGQFSFTNSDNSAMMTLNANLLRTSQGIRPAVVVYYLMMLSVLCVGYREAWQVGKRMKLVTSGLVLSLISFSWSGSPVLSLRSSVELLFTMAFAFYLSERFTTEHLMRLLMFVGVIAALASLFLIVFRPEYGIFHRGGGAEWQGIFSHKNALGAGMVFLLTPVYFAKGRLGPKIAYSALLLFLVVMSQSRGAWFEAIATAVFVGWLAISRRLPRREVLVLTGVSLIAIVSIVVISITYLGPLMRTIGKDPTLTGRTEIYAAVWDAILKRPALGYGFAAFWVPTNPESLQVAQRVNWPNIGYAENGFLELALQLGFVGVGLVLLMFWRAIRQSILLIRSRYYNSRVGWFSTIIFLELATNIEGGIVQGAGNINWALTLIAFVGLANEIRTSRAAFAAQANTQAKITAA
jgi:exopolysaccharide production protein ExoQ